VCFSLSQGQKNEAKRNGLKCLERKRKTYIEIERVKDKETDREKDKEIDRESTYIDRERERACMCKDRHTNEARRNIRKHARACAALLGTIQF
jgi:hypothetical protein